MKAFFFGAGCSHGTLQNYDACPISKDFGKYLERVGAWNSYTNLRKAAEHLGYRGRLSEIGLEELWSLIDHYAKFGKKRGFLPKPRWLWAAECELKQALIRLCGTACETAAQKIRKNTNCTIIDLLRQVRPGDIVVSFNWDTLVERLATRFTGNWTLIHCDGPPKKRKQVRFAKPHGSISWRVGSPGPVMLPCQPFLSSISEASVVRKESPTEPLLLGAVPMKSELLFEVQAFYGACSVFQVIMNQWKTVVEAVREADVLTVAGYSFPKEDEYGRFFFKEGIRQRNSSLNRIEFYNRAAESGASILEVFGKKDTEVVWKGPVTAAP